MPKTNIRAILLLCIIIAFGRQAEAGADPPAHPLRMFYDADEKLLYLPQQADYALDLRLIQAVEQMQDSGGLLPAGEAHRIKPAAGDSLFRLPEGPVEFGATLADGRRLVQQAVVDGRPPDVSLRLEAASFSTADSLYYGPPRQLRFEAFDEASGLEQIYVSINESGFMPRQEAESLIREEGYYALQFYAVDRVGNVSDIQETAFVLDLSPPQLELDIQGGKYENRLSRGASFLFDAQDARAGTARIFYRIRPNEPAAAAEPRFAIYDARIPVSLQQLSEGSYLLEAFAADQVGLHSDTLAYDFIIDDTPPALRAEAGTPVFQKDGTRYISPRTPLHLHAADSLSALQLLRYSINGGSERSYEGAFTLGGNDAENSSGLYSIAYQATDVLENESSRAIFRVFLDARPPETSYAFEGPYTGESADGSYSIATETRLRLSAEDLETGQAQIEYYIEESEGDSASWQPYEESLQFVEAGRYRLRFRATDAVENFSAATRLQLHVRDGGDFASTGTRPALPPAEKAYFLENDELIGPQSERVYLFISDTPEADGMQLLLSESRQPEAAARRFPGEGPQELRLDIGTGPMHFRLTTDARPPQTTLSPSDTPQTTGENGRIFNTDVQFRLQATDNIAGLRDIMYSIDGQAYQPYETALIGFVAQKSYVLRYYSIDKAGNKEAVQQLRFTVDATPPRSRLELLSDFSGNIVSPQTSWALRSSDNIAGAEAIFFRFNDEPDWERYTGPVPFSAFHAAGRIAENEPQKLYYYAVDAVGNTEAPREFSFRLQTRPPALDYSWRGAVVKRGDTYIAHPTARLQLFARPGNVPVRALRYRFGTRPMQRYDDTPLQFTSTTSGRFSFEAEDDIGNITETRQLRILRDASPPRSRHRISGPVLESRAGLVLGPGHQIYLRAEDEAAGTARTRLRINEGGWQPYRDAITLSQSGSYTLSYASTDSVGNEEETRRLSFRVDITPPDISLIYSRQPPGGPSGEIVRLLPGTAIAVNAIDRHTELADIFYRINGGARQEYTGPLRDLPEEAFEIRFTATDLLGNTAELVQRYTVEQ